jgi:hypothetical protein
MSFLNLFLAGFAGLAAIPIIIHLLNQRRFKVVTWAAMDFLLATLEKNSRRLQLQDLILMLLRAAAIAFLALALARPTIAPGGLSFVGQAGESAAVIVLDNSLSMGYQLGNDSRFDIAKKRAKEIIDHLPKGSGVALVLMSDVAVDEIPEPSHDLAFVAAEVQKAALSDGGTDIAVGVEQAWKILRNAPALGKEIYLVTDMQVGGWPAGDNAAWTRLTDELANAKPGVRLYLADVGDGGADNLSVDSFAAEDEQVSTENDVAFVATLHNHGTKPVRNLNVELLVGDPAAAPTAELRKAASVVVDEVQGVTQVRLETRFAAGGDHRVQVRTGLDHLAADNSRNLAVEVIDRIRVLIIDGEPAESGKTFGGESDFLKVALSPRDFDVDEHKALIDAEVTTISGLGDKTLRDYQAVILANVADLPPGLVEGLKTFVKADGHGLIIFLGDNVQAGRYNLLLRDQAGLLPGKLGERLIEAEDAPEAKEHGFGFATTDLGHPVVSFFADKDTQPFLAKPRFTKAFPIEIDPAELAGPKPAAADGKDAKPADSKDPAKTGAVNIVARFTGGQPAIAERVAGRGRVLLFASTADKDWTDLPLRPAFLMLARRAVQHVALGHRPGKTVQVNDPIVELIGAKEAGAQVTVRDPRGGTHTLAAVPTTTGDLAKIEDGQTHFAGFYQLTRANDPGHPTWFAASHPRGESNLEAIDEAGLRSRFPRLDFQWLDGHGEIGRAIDEKRVGREIWPLLFALVCLCLVAESVLALRWAPKGS